MLRRRRPEVRLKVSDMSRPPATAGIHQVLSDSRLRYTEEESWPHDHGEAAVRGRRRRRHSTGAATRCLTDINTIEIADSEACFSPMR